jgi:hypothetical protein
VNWTCEQHTHRSASPVAPLPPTRTDGCNLCPRTTATHVPGPNIADGGEVESSRQRGGWTHHSPTPLSSTQPSPISPPPRPTPAPSSGATHQPDPAPHPGPADGLRHERSDVRPHFPGFPGGADGHLRRADDHLRRADAHLGRADGHLRRIDVHLRRVGVHLRRVDVHLCRADVDLRRVDGHLQGVEQHPNRITGHFVAKNRAASPTRRHPSPPSLSKIAAFSHQIAADPHKIANLSPFARNSRRFCTPPTPQL